jgi:ATP-dependent helicase YprA (DUF1998 family)
MSEQCVYSTRAVFEGLKKKFHQYLEAQYHIWDEGLIEGRSHLLHSEGITFQEPRLEATPFYVSGDSYDKLNIPAPAKKVLELASRIRGTGIPETPYSHQTQSIEAFLGQGREIIVATGTGSGKTECFLMPILGALAVEAAQRSTSWQLPGCRALLLYPMNALVNDQLSRLRRLFGEYEIAEALRGHRPGRATFGMYTSRTQYPGQRTKIKDKKRLQAYVTNAFTSLPPKAKAQLIKEGKWPAKDLQNFVESNFETGPDDSELMSRGEMQSGCPDILVTNYSMLEYMMLRPIERTIFSQTALWLAENKDNQFTVVLDEAHMYRGSGGAEVAYLLRRLNSRLGIPRDRMRFILTSASLGKSREAESRMKEFAAQLSGANPGAKEFLLIRGQQLEKPNARSASDNETRALASFKFASLHDSIVHPQEAIREFEALSKALEHKTKGPVLDQDGLQNSIYSWLSGFGPAALVTNLLTSKPQKLGDIVEQTFSRIPEGEVAIEALLALMSFAKDKETGRVFSPVRSHLFFRGLPGIYACINSKCSVRHGNTKSVLGNLYSVPMLRCECGSRVYEVLTHRDCGAAFIRGYLSDQYGDFLWDQPSSGLRSDGGLLETHLLVEVGRRSQGKQAKAEGSSIWLQKSTGKLIQSRPGEEVADMYIELLRPDGLVQVRGESIHSFDRECPVCTRAWKSGFTKIMDLSTKGEAPFAQLVRTQVELQPQTIPITDSSPNGGRKSLLFSDGRQKAARLARDIPREIENDVFRQLLLLAAIELKKVGKEQTLGSSIYVALVNVLARNSLLLLDGRDKEHLYRDVLDHRKYYKGDLSEALLEAPESIPPRISSLLLRNLGSDFYSLSALTLAHLKPARKAQNLLIDALPHVDPRMLLNLCNAWIQRFASQFAINPHLASGIRSQAAGYPVAEGPDVNGGFSTGKVNFLSDHLPDIRNIFQVFSEILCQKSPAAAGLFLVPNKIALQLASEEDNWYQCSQCANVSPVEWWGHCPNCLAPNVISVRPGATEYLRARKSFFRDPVIELIKTKATPFNLSVEEHTAQLSYKDVDDASTTTEDFERRFRDILVRSEETSIDVLSSTTTMEVGIDIGSLVAVGLRNIPPLRQNYQQRAGRAGRRGTAVSTVVTYAQNSPHDSHYFENPGTIIAGEPTLPGVDTDNEKIVERHIRAQFIQEFFHSQNLNAGSADIFSVLGSTMGFFDGDGEFSLLSFKKWLEKSPGSIAVCTAIQQWLPFSFKKAPRTVALEFVARLDAIRPASVDELDPSEEDLIEYMFAKGFLPAYAFPRDLCALQIEKREKQGNYSAIKTVQRPQQGLNIALSEYAPGRLVVVDKKTYRIGTVAAGGSSKIVNRSERLFRESKTYVHCTECQYTPGFTTSLLDSALCPVCGRAALRSATVIEPQVVYPEGGREINELDDEQTFSNATSAQLSVSEGAGTFNFQPIGKNAHLAFARDQQLVMVNKGEENGGDHSGFLICDSCGKSDSDGAAHASHDRDYLIAGEKTGKCTGKFVPVYLGYGFSSDVLVLRVPLSKPLLFDPLRRISREPMADAFQSLSEAIVIGISHHLDIDVREISAGFRFLKIADMHFADIFVFDNIAGGAGYATEAGEQFPGVLEKVSALLQNCTCSSSCDKCLRHYGNRFYHTKLDRNLASTLLEYAKDGILPQKPTRSEQREILKPLAELMSLAGWNESGGSDASLVISRDGRTKKIFAYPSLIEPEYYGFGAGLDLATFSPYELARDLPGVCKELS